MTPQDYTLPPDLYAKAVAFAHAQYLVYFGATASTLLILFLILRLGVGVHLRDFAERRSRRLPLQTALFAPGLLLLVGLATLPWLVFAHRTSLRFGISVERLLAVDGRQLAPERVYRKIAPAGHEALQPEEAWVRKAG